ncbi:Flagellar cap protein [Dermatophilus congolensis]|uniref:Flagellar hook-associated protein 2 n=1 Tax=Dermatophilus congolensis TaxID=1863 RepID=A0AA46BP34_9MICO|nr:flagellar filament capping protein FliD [Dermatophilus congolensis]STD11897.1 Flagellar cap protein [Dermatophilus congolensis]
MQISGLGSGVDTAAMVSQLMSVERQAGNYLTKGKINAQALVNAYTSLNTKMKAIGDAANQFVPKSVIDTPAWNSVTAKSSDESIAKVTTGTGAQAGTLTFAVKSIAQASTSLADKSFNSTDTINGANGGAAFDFNITANGKTTNVSVGQGAKLADVVAAINQQAGADVKATMVQTATGSYQMQLTSATTGAQSSVTVTNGSTPPVVADVLGNFNEVTKGQDTVLHIGDATSGYDVTSTTKEVKNLLPGITISPVKADPNTQVTVDVGQDTAGISKKVEDLVTAANDALSNIRINSRYVKDKPSDSGPFVGDSLTRDLTNRLQSAAVGTSAAAPSAAGISIDKTGAITFDKKKFEELYAKDPAAAQKAVNAFASSLSDVSTQATDADKGLITMQINGQNSVIKDYSSQITKFNERMELRQQSLEAQFKAMDSLLSKMKTQGNWLSGQLAGLQ